MWWKALHNSEYFYIIKYHKIDIKLMESALRQPLHYCCCFFIFYRYCMQFSIYSYQQCCHAYAVLLWEEYAFRYQMLADFSGIKRKFCESYFFFCFWSFNRVVSMMFVELSGCDYTQYLKLFHKSTFLVVGFIGCSLGSLMVNTRML